MRRALTIVCLTAIAAVASRGAGDTQGYPVSEIPAGLRKNAHAVIRSNVETLDVASPRHMTLTVSNATTVFDEEGRRHGLLVLPYDRFTSISNLDGHLYDASGREVRALSGDDIHDFSAISGWSLYEDSRARSAEVTWGTFPYTVAFSYSVEYEGSVTWPAWIAQPSDEPVMHSQFTVVLPASMRFRYWSSRADVPPVILKKGEIDTYTWSAENLPELPPETLEEDLDERTTVVRTAPTNFEIDGHIGNMSSWERFGAWYRDLCLGRDVLPASAAEDIHRLVRPEDSAAGKIDRIYRYVQSRTRYVSVQLGIGSWQPFDASYVHTRSYGDCKALSNYTVALLKEAGIPAFPALVYGGEPKIRFATEFSSNQFNHVIVCVPQSRDTVWLECTSQTLPMGHLGRFTEGKQALLITPGGGVLVRTPASGPGENRLSRSALVALSPNGSAEGSVLTLYTGDQVDDVRHGIESAKDRDRRAWLLSDLQMQNVTLLSDTIDGIDAHKDPVRVALRFSAGKYAAASGERLFFIPNLTDRRVSVPPKLQSRLSPVRLPYCRHDSDSVRFTFPREFGIETLPAPVQLSSGFGTFESRTDRLDDTTLVYARSLVITNATIPAGQYDAYRYFFARIAASDRAQAVLVNRATTR